MIKLIQDDLALGNSGHQFENAFRSMWDANIDQVLAKIREKFGLLTIDSWWELVFRSPEGRAAVVFIDLIQTQRAAYATMNYLELLKFISRSARWREAITGDPDLVSNGMGPWVPEDT